LSSPETARLPVAQAQHLADGCASVAFVSDLHLCEEVPHTAAAFSRFLTSCEQDSLFILGDLFEAWVGDELLDCPFEARCARELAALAARIPVHVMRGNRDFLLGRRFFKETGCIELADPTLLSGFGQRLLLTHGDALCVADTDYQRFRAEVRSAPWQAAFLSRPFEARLAMAKQMRMASQAHQQASLAWIDADAELAALWMHAARAETLVHGHTHRPSSGPLGRVAMRHVLSDWDLDHILPPRAELMVWSPLGWAQQSLIHTE
jgi:UDP-2,3-diacylglucosamine hydrolase